MHLVLSCISRTVWYVGPSPYGESLGLLPQEFPIELPPAQRLRLRLRPTQAFDLVETDDGWKVRTAAYSYHVFSHDRDYADREILAWHWHPASRPDPHLHANLEGVGREFDRTHLPTGRVTFEDVVRFLIRELGVAAIRAEWRTVLQETEGRHREYRTWS